MAYVDALSMAASTRNGAIVNGLSMSWLEWPDPGNPSKCSVLILHGILQNAEGMSSLARHLAPYHRVVAPDLRGRGETGQPADGYQPATIAHDLAMLIPVLELERLVVIGRIHGGVVGYHLAASAPDLVHGLILGDTRPEISPERAERRLRAIHAMPRSFESLEAAVSFYQRGLGLSEERARHDIPHDLAIDDGRYIWKHNLDIIARIEAASSPRSDWDVLQRIAAPTLVLRGQRGRIALETADRMKSTMPRCELQTIFGANHDVFMGPGAEQALGAIDMFLMRLNRV